MGCFAYLFNDSSFATIDACFYYFLIVVYDACERQEPSILFAGEIKLETFSVPLPRRAAFHAAS